MNKIITKLQSVIKAIKRIGDLIVSAFRPEYEDWLPNGSEAPVLSTEGMPKTSGPTPETIVSPGPVEEVNLNQKNEEIAALQAKLAEYQKEIKETEKYRDEVRRIKEALASNANIKKVGRPSKNRVNKTIKVDTVLVILFSIAKENDLLKEDFSSTINVALHTHLKESYPAVYALYEQAIDDNKSNF